jgi:uncharacterized membrane protein (UPF0127 family)
VQEQKISNAKILKTKTKQISGLMFRKTITQPYLFNLNKETNIRIHTFFCRFPLDIIFLNRNKEVVEIKRNVKPWKFIGKTPLVKYIIEGKAGWFDHINVSDKITWEE